MAQDFDGVWLTYFQPKNFFQKRGLSKTKERITRLQMSNMLRRTLKMFEWKGLPDTIPQRILELNLQTRGHVGIFENDGKLHCSWGNLGGVPNYNYMPQWYIISNPYLKGVTGKAYNIYGEDKNIVVMPNDSLYEGLVDILSYHSEILTEIQLTKRCIIIRKRMPDLLTAPDNNTKIALDGWLDDLEEGRLASIMDRNLLKSINSVQSDNSDGHGLLTQVLEMEQYQKASMFNDIGLQMNYNMKRETITSSEAQLGESALLPLPDDMYEMRQFYIKEVNELFGVKWECEFSSAWKDLRKSIQVGMQIDENKANPSTIQSTVQGENNEQREEIPDSGEPEPTNSNNDEETADNTNGAIEQAVEQIIENAEQIAEVIEDETEKTD